jgi:hypothetical protein
MMKKMRHLLCFFIAVGFIARVVGVNFGLPFVYHDDEPIIVNYALAYGAGDFNPRMFNVPPFLSYFLFAIYGLFYLVGLASGMFSNTTEFAYLFLNDPTIFYVIGRVILGVLPGTISVFFIYHLGKRVFGEKEGLIAAFFLALNFMHVRDSHYIYFDVPLVFFLILLLIKSMDIISKNRAWDHIWAGVLLGVVTATKYFGPVMAPFFVAVFAHNLVRYKEKVSIFLLKVGGFAVISVLTFLALNPFALLDHKRFLSQVMALPMSSVGPWFHVKVSLAGGMGIGMFIFGVLGIILSLLKRRKQAVFIAVFVISYYFVLAGRSQAAERYVMPLIPPLIIFSSYFVVELMKLFKAHTLRNIGVISISLVLVLPSAYRIWLVDRIFLKEDTRTQAYGWVKENIDRGSLLALDATSSGFPRLEKSKEQIAEAYGSHVNTTFGISSEAIDLKSKMILSNPGYTEETYVLYYLRGESEGGFHSIYPSISIELDEVEGKNIEYLILANIVQDGVYDEFREEVQKHAELLTFFSPYREGIDRINHSERTAVPAAAFSIKELTDRTSFGPYIEIYKMRQE